MDCQLCSSFEYDSCTKCRAGKRVVEGVCFNSGVELPFALDEHNTTSQSGSQITYYEPAEDDDDDKTGIELCFESSECTAVFVICIVLVVGAVLFTAYNFWQRKKSSHLES
jgi:hypothetical protein